MSATRPPIHDERTSGSAEASRRGAHRARAKPVTAGLPVLAGVLVVCLVVGIAYLVLGQRGDDREAGAGLEAAVSNPTSSVVAPQASAPAASAPAAASSAAQSRTGTQQQPKKKASAPVNRGVELAVLNATGVQGLAKQVATRIEPKGWSVGRTGNATASQRGLATTKVYYTGATSKPTAIAMVQDLGYGVAVADGTVISSGKVGSDGLVVVLGADARS